MSFSVGDIVISRAGHDNGNLYIIVEWENEQALVADGKIKKLDTPKKKNPKHLELVGSCDAEACCELKGRCGVFSRSSGTGDAQLRKMLKAAALNFDKKDKR